MEAIKYPMRFVRQIIVLATFWIREKIFNYFVSLWLEVNKLIIICSEAIVKKIFSIMIGDVKEATSA